MKILIKSLPLLIILYGLWGYYTEWDEHETEKKNLVIEAANKEKEIEKALKKEKEIQVFMKNKDAVTERIKEVFVQIKKTQKILPVDNSVTSVLGLLDRSMKELNIQDVDTSPGQTSHKGFYFESTYTVSGSATFLQYLVFLEQLMKSERLLNVKEVSLEMKNLDRGRFQMLRTRTVLQSYRYNEAHRERTGIEDIDNAKAR